MIPHNNFVGRGLVVQQAESLMICPATMQDIKHHLEPLSCRLSAHARADFPAGVQCCAWRSALLFSPGLSVHRIIHSCTPWVSAPLTRMCDPVWFEDSGRFTATKFRQDWRAFEAAVPPACPAPCCLSGAAAAAAAAVRHRDMHVSRR